MKILVIDNYDSFTYNLVQLLGGLKCDVFVKRNDETTVQEIGELKPDKIMISPGPGRPENSNVSLDVIKELGNIIPVLGVCLGHQAIGITFGAKVVKASKLMHGKTSPIKHSNESIFKNLPQNFEATRYHSLIIQKRGLPKELKITAESDDGMIMGIKHVKFPLTGIQFHPESILTREGKTIIQNWLDE
jgi:anthranilate synthase component II